MKTKKPTKHLLALLMSVLMLMSALMPAASALSSDSAKLTTGMKITSQTSYTIAPGVSELHITTNNADGNDQAQGYALEADINNPSVGVIASYKDYELKNNKWGLQTVRDQATVAELKNKDTNPNFNVVAGVNGDFFNMGTGEPTGTFVMNGVKYTENTTWPYFAITKDGEPKIGRTASPEEIATFKEAIGGPAMIVENGAITDDARINDYGLDQMPRTAVGITATGSIVMFVVDGRQAPMSCGMKFTQLADAMVALGCVDALSLDGGGSSTFLSQHEGNNELVCRNNPCDGSERRVSSALLVYSTATPTGEFHHATISPNNDVYTPNSSVDFKAEGVDSSGSAADLPSDGYLALADESFGSMTGNTFTSNGKKGTVVVNYMSNGAVTGSTSIEIQKPDNISFIKEELSLAFDQESTLGLVAKYNGRVMHIKAGDINWQLTDPLMGTFNGNTFTASPDKSINGTITATSAYDDSITAELSAIIGRQPCVIWDFEDPAYYTFATGYLNANGGIAQYLTGDSTCNMLLGSYTDNVDGNIIGRGAKGSAEVVDLDTGIVRLGSHSLKINYDFTNQLDDKIDGICIGSYSPTSTMEGTPTAIGLWVYAPEGTPNFWLRIRIWDAGANNGAGAVSTLNFTVRGDSNPPDGVGGVNWQGWKYVEAQLTGVGPFSLLGGECVRFMNCANYSQNGNKTVTGITNPDGTLEYKPVVQAERKGCVYIDNVQFVYGSNTQDVDNPIIDTIQVGNQSRDNMKNIVADTKVDTNEVCIQTTFHDVQNKYTTGIDYENKAYGIYIDGKNVTDKAICYNDDQIFYYGTLANGLHSVKVLIRDCFGNEKIETRYFSVNGTEDYPTVKISTDSTECILNGDFSFSLSSNKVDAITGVVAHIALDPDIVLSESDIGITYAPGFSGTSAYDTETGILTLTVSGTGTKADDWDKIATVTTKIASDVAIGKSYSYKVADGQITFSDTSISTDTFASAEVSEKILATYCVTAENMIIGTSGTFYITNTDGTVAANVNLYKDDGTFIGTSHANGKVFYNNYNDSVQAFTVYAEKDGKYSFRLNSQSYKPGGNADGTPSYIISDAVTDGATEKKISWMSSPAETDNAAKLQYTTKAQYDAGGTFTTADGKSTIYTYDGSSVDLNYAARINSVEINGLTPDTEYVYRIGDGTTWSAVDSFKTGTKNTDTSFFVFGDIQAVDMTIANNTIKKVASDGVDYAFGIQAGDAVETANIYNLWTDALGVFADAGIKNTDMIHVYGNHEFFADGTALSSQLMYGIDEADRDYYSVTYGDVYVAVINWQVINNEDAFLKAMDWLKDDAAKSDALWKVLTIHAPVYNTNVDANISWITEKLPKFAQEAGICAVFSGHDHAYSRTKPMTDQQVDTENGIVYYIVGNVGEKSYSTTITPEYNIDCFIPRSDYTGIYLSITATDKEMSINTYDVNGTDSIIVDSYTISSKSECIKDGHEYEYSNGNLVCSVCGYTTSADDFTGVATDKNSGLTVYVENGVLAKNIWMNINDSIYYFGADGLPLLNEQKIGDYTYKFDSEGKLTVFAFVMPDGTLKANEWYQIGTDNYYFGADGLPLTGEQKAGKYTYTFADDGKLVNGALVKIGNYYYYFIADIAQRGWHEIDGNWYYFDRQRKDSYGYKMNTGVFTITNSDNEENLTFTADSTGKLIKGAWRITSAGTSYVWANNERLTGWQYIDGAVYYLDPITTYRVTDNSTIDDKEYTFAANGKLQMTSDSVKIDEFYYSFDANGVLMTNHIKDHPYNPVIDEAVTATYTSTGLTAGEHCGTCGDVIIAQTEIPKLEKPADPETTTAAPETTTAAPETTTAAPETTTASSETTTAAPETTTVAPETTTVAPETTTVAPETTTVAPETTTVAPETTTVEPISEEPSSEEPSSEEPDFRLLLGDLNRDKFITSADARIALRVSAGLEKIDNAILMYADVVVDGEIKANDARKILRVSAKIDKFDEDAWSKQYK